MGEESMMAMSGGEVVFGIVLGLLAVAVLGIWALVLVIVFLRLRIAELRTAASGGAPADPLS